MSLWLPNAVLVLLTLLFLLKPLMTKRSKLPEQHSRQRQELLASRLAEIEREHSVGLIDADQYDDARRETEAFYGTRDDDTSDKKAPVTSIRAVIVVMMFVLGSAGFYFKYSDGHRILTAEKQTREVIGIFNSMTASLRNHLERNPQDVEARLQLAEAYYLIGDYAGAVTEYRLVENSGSLTDGVQWLNYADALLRSGDVEQSGGVMEMLEKLLNAEPDNRRTLFISASVYFEREEYARAIDLWQRLLALSSSSEPDFDSALRELILQARNKLATDTDGSDTKSSAGAITITVSLAAALSSMASPDDVVFVYARAIGASPMPIAVRRLTVSELPANVTLNDGDAMAGNMTLSQFDQVEVVARVSKSGQALMTSGDFIGVASPVAVGESIEVEIAEVVN